MELCIRAGERGMEREKGRLRERKWIETKDERS